MALVAAYAFNEGTGTTAAEASGGTTLTGVPGWAAGLHDDALRLNLVNGPSVDPFGSSTAFTIMFDVYIDGSGNGSYNLFIDGTIGEIGIIQQASGGSLEWYPWFGPTGTTVATATWTHIAVVATGTARRVLVAGTQVATTSNTELSGTNPFTLGGESGFEPNIRIDNLRIYDEALDNAAIAALAGTEVTSGGTDGNVAAVAATATAAAHVPRISGAPVEYVSQGAAVAGTTSITTAAYGTDWLPGDLGVCVVASNHATVEATEPTVAGFTNVGTLNGGGGSQGAGTGNRRLTFFTRELQAGDDTTPAIDLATGNVMVAAITIFRKPPSHTWATAVAAFGAETTAGTSWSESMTTNPVLDAADMAVLACAVRDTSGSSAEGITATGATFGTVTERADLASETGNDINLHVNTCTVLTGPSSAAPVCTATHATSETGVMGVLRIRSVGSADGTVVTVTATATGAAGIPVVAGGTDANVAGVAATVTAAALAPVVEGEAVVSGGGPATASMAAPAPSVSAGSVIAAIAATVTIAALAPTVSSAGEGAVTSVTAAATAAAVAPVVSGSASVEAVAATATASAPAPVVAGAGTVNVEAVVATSTATAVAPAVAGQQNPTTAAVTATATASATAPTVSGSSTVTATTATATAQAVAPTVITDANVTAIVAGAVAAAVSPEVAGITGTPVMPASRTITVSAENRVIVVPSENRTMEA